MLLKITFFLLSRGNGEVAASHIKVIIIESLEDRCEDKNLYAVFLS